MDTHAHFCHNPACPARGQADQGNIVIHSRQEQRYHCTLCQQTFSARQGTPYYRGHVPEDVQTRVLTLIAYGCPIEAAARAFALQSRTIRRWVAVAGATPKPCMSTWSSNPAIWSPSKPLRSGCALKAGSSGWRWR